MAQVDQRLVSRLSQLKLRAGSVVLLLLQPAMLRDLDTKATRFP